MQTQSSSLNSRSSLDLEEQDPDYVNTSVVKGMGQYVLKYPWILFFAILLILVGTLASLLEPFLFGYAIDHVIITKKWDLLKFFVGLFLCVELLRLISTVSHQYLFALLGQKVMQDLRLTVFSHLQRLPVIYYDKNPVGKLVTRVTNDIAALAELFSSGFATILANFLVVLGILIWLFSLDYKLAVIALSIFPFLIVSSAYFSKFLRISYRETRSKLSALNAFLAENILGMKVIHLFCRQKTHLSRFEKINTWFTQAQISTVRVFAFLQPSITWCTGITMAILIWAGSNRVLDGSLKIGVLVAFFSYAHSLFQPIREIADKWNIFLSGMASAERIFSILSYKTEFSQVVPNIEIKKDIQGHIVFENVSFAYIEEQWVLKDFNAEIKPGMKVGIVGHTGAGKTTLTSLLLRFYDPQKGRVLLDGKDIREFEKPSLRKIFGVIQQDVFLFSGTPKENITLWSDTHVQIPPSFSKFFSNELKLVERGVNLSLGQRQVLAFARALSSNPAIWILDEATANIDSETEKELEQALFEFTLDKTAILIAHRLSTVQQADLILVLNQGFLAEQGRHEDLVKKNGLYARLYRYHISLQAPSKIRSVSVS